MKIKDTSLLTPVFQSEMIMEKRMENDANGNPIYIGYAIPGTTAAADKWLIVKITYDANQAPTRYQIANDSVAFVYVWDDRATYF